MKIYAQRQLNDLTYIKGATSHHKISICSKSRLDLSTFKSYFVITNIKNTDQYVCKLLYNIFHLHLFCSNVLKTINISTPTRLARRIASLITTCYFDIFTSSKLIHVTTVLMLLQHILIILQKLFYHNIKSVKSAMN